MMDETKAVFKNPMVRYWKNEFEASIPSWLIQYMKRGLFKMCDGSFYLCTRYDSVEVGPNMIVCETNGSLFLYDGVGFNADFIDIKQDSFDFSTALMLAKQGLWLKRMIWKDMAFCVEPKAKTITIVGNDDSYAYAIKGLDMLANDWVVTKPMTMEGTNDAN